MQKFGRSIIVLAILALAGAISGCAIRFPRLTLSDGDSPAEARPSQSATPSNTRMPYRTATGALPTYTGGATSPGNAAVPQGGNPVSSTFKKATRSVVDALTIKPKVVKARDPTSLSSPTGPIGPDLYVTAARLAESNEEFGDAQTQYEKALAVQADYLPALVGLSRLHHRRGDVDLSIHYGRQAVEADPKSAVAHNDLGLCYARQRQFDAAIQSLSQAVQLQPRSKLYRNNLAASLVFAGRLNEAQMHLGQAHGDAAVQYNLGYLLYQQGRTDECVAYFQRALRLDPQLRPAAQMLMRLRAPGSAPTVARPDAGRRFHQVGVESPPRNVLRRNPPSTQPPARNEGYVPTRRLPPVTGARPRMGVPLSPPVVSPPVEGLRVDTPPPNIDAAWPNPAPSQTRRPTVPGDPSRASEFPLPPVVSPEKYSGPISGPSSMRGFDAKIDRGSRFPIDASVPGPESSAAPLSPSHSAGPQSSNVLNFRQSAPSDPGTSESLALPSADDASRTEPLAGGANQGDAFDDIRTRPPPMMESDNPLRLGAPSRGPVGNGTRRLAPPPMSEDTPAPVVLPAPIVSPPHRAQTYELWPDDSR